MRGTPNIMLLLLLGSLTTRRAGGAFGVVSRRRRPTTRLLATSTTTTTTTTTTEIPRLRTVDAQTACPTVSVQIQGWVRTIRKQKKIAFVQVNDGSNLAGLQCVVPISSSDDALEGVTTGSAVQIVGTIVESQGGNQAVELAATELQLIGSTTTTNATTSSSSSSPSSPYPLAKKRHSLEYLRTVAHLRSRTNTIAAVARVRSRLAAAIHEFFQQQNFVYLQTPLITVSDCEGAGEMFRVTTLDLDNVNSIPQNDDKTTDFGADFFGRPAYLTVSGQLAAETYACALGDVYTFGPTFRAENSQTTRHLAEFHMVEPEMAFCDLETMMQNAEDMLKFTVGRVLEQCAEDLQFLNKFYDDQLLNRLQQLVEQPFARCSYREAIDFLKEEIAKDPKEWQYPDVEFGTDLATEHERWLAETKFGGKCVFVYDYPANIKAFYMRNNDKDAGETVNAMDLLVPGVGELIGGSQREERLEVLEEKLRAADLDPEDYWWYLDLRRYGTVPHSGYGLGFERLVTYVCGIENIRDAIAFPRSPGNAEF